MYKPRATKKLGHSGNYDSGIVNFKWKEHYQQAWRSMDLYRFLYMHLVRIKHDHASQKACTELCWLSMEEQNLNFRVVILLSWLREMLLRENANWKQRARAMWLEVCQKTWNCQILVKNNYCSKSIWRKKKKKMETCKVAR